MGDRTIGTRAMGNGPAALPDGVFRIPLPTPLPVGDVNAYVLMGDVPTLVDVGPCTSAAVAALQEGLRQIGLGPGDIGQVVITHPHADHAGLARWVAERSGAPILAHAHTARWLADPEGAIDRTVRFVWSWGERQGIPTDVLGLLARGFVRWAGLSRPAEVSGMLAEGDSVSAGEHVWRVMYTPGHSTGHVILYREADGTLISGDHLLPQGASSTLLEAAQQPAGERARSGLHYLAALSQITLLDIGTVLPGHGAPFGGVTRGFLLKRIASVRGRAEQAFRLLEERPLTIWELCHALFPRVTPDMLIFAVSNVAGYLDLLSANGRIAKRNDGDIVRYVALGVDSVIAV